MPIELLTEQQLEAIRLREVEHFTYKKIGEKLGVGVQRAREIYRTAARIKNRPPSWRDGLSARIHNVLINHNLWTMEEVVAAIKDGRLHPQAKSHIRNYGWFSHVQLCRHLGLPKPQKSQRIILPTTCPYCGRSLKT